MVAQYLRRIIVGIVLALAALAAISMSTGRVMWLIVGSLAAVATYVAILGAQFVLLRWSASDSPDQPSIPALLQSMWREVRVAPTVFLWRQAFRGQAIADHLSPSAVGQRGVVFIHGLVCNRGIWNPWLRRLRDVGVPYVAVDLEPVFCSIATYAATIQAAAEKLINATGRPPIVVAHSMGGLAARAWLSDTTHRALCDHVVTIATPHRGTWLARFGHGINAREMRIGSPWLAALAEREAAASSFPRMTCFWSHCDNIVFPARTATLPGADNRHLERMPHLAMVYHPAVIDEVLRLLQAPPSSPTGGPCPPANRDRSRAPDRGPQPATS